MTYLLLETFLLLLASYFLGAFLACTTKRAIMGSRETEPAHVVAREPFDAPLRPPVATLAPRPIAPRPVAPPVVPRPIDPVQPRIDVIRRPEPRPMPKLVDPSRFERALMGPDPNEGMPRRAIPEIRPAVLRPVTGAYVPGSYGPPPEPEPEIPPPPPPPVQEIIVEPEPVAVEPQWPPDEVDDGVETPPETVEAPPEKPGRLSRLSDATTSAAAAAVAAAKAAAAASIVSIARRPAPEPPREEPAPSESSVGKPAEAPDEIFEEPVEEPAEDTIEEDTFEDELDEEPLEAADDTDEQPDVDDFVARAPSVPVLTPQPLARTLVEGGDDFQRIRAIDAEIEQRLKAEGIDSFEHIAAWNAADVKRIGQLLGMPGRIDREQWIEQAQILAKGGETYYSRNRVAAQKAATPIDKPASIQLAELTAEETPDQSEEAETPRSEPAPASATSEDKQEESAPPEPAVAPPQPQLSGVAAAIQGRSVAEMAAAAAAAIAAASASVTRGLKPIEPISPLSKVDPKISMPAKLSDAIKEKEAATAQAAAEATTDVEVQPPRPMAASSQGSQDDLKRIRGVGVLIEKRLNAMGFSRYDQIANWTSGDIDRVSQVLEFKGRIEREGWVEQARILLNGGQTEFSRRVDRGEVDTSRET